MSSLTGEKLRFLLAASHKTQRDLATFLDISTVQISRWTHDVKPIPKVHHHKIAKFFDISIECLTKDIPEKNKLLYDMISDLSKDERLDLIVYIANTLGGAQ